MRSSLLRPSAETTRPPRHPSRPPASSDAKEPAESSEIGSVEMLETASVGRLSESVYERLLPRRRLRIRQLLCRSLAWEMPWLEFIQNSLRCPVLDSYFVHTSLLGTHSFFLLFMPCFFFFGFGEQGRGLLYILAAGGYSTSVLKDLFCVPRPFSPPLVRLSTGKHGIEYGFPSTHSTTSVSMCLFLCDLFVDSQITRAALVFLAGSVVFGRAYTGMHSMVDIGVGSFIGWAVYALFRALELEIEFFTVTQGWLVPAVVVPTTLFLVFVHPAPVEDCPCFEDAVAFVAVFAGIMIGRNLTPQNFNLPTAHYALLTPTDYFLFPLIVILKQVLGILAIFTYRLAAKKLSHFLLPSIFRAVQPLVVLSRRHYADTSTGSGEGYVELAEGMKPVPSLLDLASLDEEVRVEPVLMEMRELGSGGMRRRNGSVAKPPTIVVDDEEDEMERVDSTAEDSYTRPEISTKQDADVLTKVICYAGIGWIAAIGAPWFFEWSGLSAAP